MKFKEFTMAFNKLEKLKDIAEASRCTIRENEDSKPFWEAHADFKNKLKEGIENKQFLISLHKKQFVQFIAWCSSYRPIEPVSILIKVSGMLDKDDDN